MDRNIDGTPRVRLLANAGGEDSQLSIRPRMKRWESASVALKIEIGNKNESRPLDCLEAGAGPSDVGPRICPRGTDLMSVNFTADIY